MMIYTVLLMLIPLLGQIFFISPLELKLPLPESEQSLLWGAGVACSADVLPSFSAGTRDRWKGGGESCSVCVNGRERGREKESTCNFLACKSWRAVSSMDCSHSQCKGKKNTVTAVTPDRILSQQKSGSCASCHHLWQGIEGIEASVPTTVLGFKENLVCAGWQHHFFSSGSLCKFFQTALWAVYTAPAMPSVHGEGCVL